jgi:hypothetical protein
MSRTITNYHSQFFSPEESTELYNKLKSRLVWQDGVYSSKARCITRKAHAIDTIPESIEEAEIHSFVARALDTIGAHKGISGIYVNYYRNGNDWAPAHSHPGHRQLVISLGATRQLRIGKKIYEMSNGDVITFGSGIHEIIRDPSITEGRISIAVFIPNDV